MEMAVCISAVVALWSLSVFLITASVCIVKETFWPEFEDDTE